MTDGNEIAEIYRGFQYSPVFREINLNRDPKLIQRNEVYFVSARRKSFEEWFPGYPLPRYFDYDKEILMHLMVRSRIDGGEDHYFRSIRCQTWEKTPDKIQFMGWDCRLDHSCLPGFLCNRNEWRAGLRAYRTVLLSNITRQPEKGYFDDDLHGTEIYNRSLTEKWRRSGWIHPDSPEHKKNKNI